MTENRDKNLRKKCLERDKFICQKCKLEDKTGRKLEAHHPTPLYQGGKDELENTITLCFDCHFLAPNEKEAFEEYLEEEMDGTATNFVKALNKVRQEHPELFE